MPVKHTAKSYKVGDRVHIRAQQVWLILVHCARLKRTITYGEVATLMGFDSTAARTSITPVAIVAIWCKNHGLPLLNTLVVTKDTGEPGHQVILKDGETAAQGQQRVFGFDWFSVRVPTPGQFRTAWEGFEG